MKWYELAIYAINVALVFVGMALYQSHGIWLALLPWCGAAVIFLTYLYRAKLLPFNRGKAALDELAQSREFAVVTANSDQAGAMKHCLKEFPGFDGRVDMKGWYVAEKPVGTIMLGSYALPANLHYGFFLVVAFPPELVPGYVKLLKTSARRIAMKARDEENLAQLPDWLQDAIEATAFDVQVAKGLLLIDLDARETTVNDLASGLIEWLDVLDVAR